jgi:hypothetical protein
MFLFNLTASFIKDTFYFQSFYFVKKQNYVERFPIYKSNLNDCLTSLYFTNFITTPLMQ